MLRLSIVKIDFAFAFGLQFILYGHRRRVWQKLIDNIMKNMKKFVSRFVFILSLVAMFTSCTIEADIDGGIDSDILYGRWEAVTNYVERNGEWFIEKTYYASECIWKFDSFYLTITEPNNINSGREQSYTHIKDKIRLGGGSLVEYKVNILTLNKLEIEWERTEMFKRQKVKRVFRRM